LAESVSRRRGPGFDAAVGVRASSQYDAI
jgi:hypothetical protein